MPSTPDPPGLAQERTALAWQRSGLALAVIAALLLRHGGWAAIASAAAVASAAALAARRRLGKRALAMVTVGVALISCAIVVAGS